MRISVISLKPSQVEILKTFLEKTIKGGRPRNDEWLLGYTRVHDLNFRFDHYCTNGILSINICQLYSILNFISDYMINNRIKWTAVIHYQHSKLVQDIWFQSLRSPADDQENWKWFVKSFNPDKREYEHFRKW